MDRSIHFMVPADSVAGIMRRFASIGRKVTAGPAINATAAFLVCPTGRVHPELLDVGEVSLAVGAAQMTGKSAYFRGCTVHPQNSEAYAAEQMQHSAYAIDNMAERDYTTVVRKRRAVGADGEQGCVVEPASSPRPYGSRPVVAHVMPWGFDVGGAQRMLHSLIRHGSSDWDVHLFSTVTRCPTWDYAPAKVHACSTMHDLARRLKALNPDVLVHHYPQSPVGQVVPTSQAVVWVLHSERCYTEPFPRWSVPSAILANYKPDTLPKPWDEQPLSVVPLGVDLQRYRPSPEPPSLVVGIVGRISPEKLPLSFCDALRDWPNRHGWRVRFIGRGIVNDYQPAVSERLAGMPLMEFTGDVHADDMPAQYAGLSALLVPSITETGSYAIVEAMACGLPVIARNVGGIPYQTGGHAILADTDAELLFALDELGDNEPFRRRMARASLAEAKDRHDVQDHAEAHAAKIRAALAPCVTWLMPVHDTKPEWLREAWTSMAAQTMRRWRAIIVDDGSRVAETIAALDEIAADPRVTLVRLPENVGVAGALNAGLAWVTTPLVARMDSDDTTVPYRLAVQVDYMARHPECAVCGGQLEYLVTGRRAALLPHVVTDEYAETHDWLANHPSVTMRVKELRSLGGYAESVQTCQDLDLWLRMLDAGMGLHNLPDVLLHYREHPGQQTHRPDFRGGIEAARSAWLQRRNASKRLEPSQCT